MAAQLGGAEWLGVEPPGRPAEHVQQGESATVPSAQAAEGSPHLGGEEVRLLPGGEVAAPVDLLEVGEAGVDRLGPARGVAQISPGKVVKPTGTATGGGGWPLASAAASARPSSQYDRAADAAVPVSQYSVMLSRMSSRVRLPTGCPSTNARAILW